MRLICSALISLSLWAGTCRDAAAQDLPLIEQDGEVSGTAGQPGGDLYRVVGLAGTRLQASLELAGHGAVALYGPDGEELARAEGAGTAVVSATLQIDALYLLGVTRAQPGGSYVLRLSRDLSQVVFADTAPAAPEGAAPPATAAAVTLPQPYDADPAVWGVYAKLAGRQTRSAVGANAPMWGWGVPGKELLEMWRTPAGALVHVNAITLTGRPGELLMQPYPGGGKKWIGTVATDGGVIYIGDGLRKAPHRVELTPDGVYQMRRITLRGGDVLSSEPAEQRSQWTLIREGEPR